MSDDAPDFMIPARRLLVVDDLGTVRRGDHVILVGNVIVAVDTSRRETTPQQDLHHPATRRPAAQPPAQALREAALPIRPTRRPAAAQPPAQAPITEDRLLELVRQHEPVDSVTLMNDHLLLSHDAYKERDKVKRMLAKLTQDGQLRRAHKPNYKRLYNYRMGRSRSNKTVLSGDDMVAPADVVETE